MLRRNFLAGIIGACPFVGLSKFTFAQDDRWDIVKRATVIIEDGLTQNNDIIDEYDTKASKIWYDKVGLKLLLDKSLSKSFLCRGCQNCTWKISSTLNIQNKYLRDNRIDIVNRAFENFGLYLKKLIQNSGFNAYSNITIKYTNTTHRMSKIIVTIDVEKLNSAAKGQS